MNTYCRINISGKVGSTRASGFGRLYKMIGFIFLVQPGTVPHLNKGINDSLQIFIQERTL